VEVVSIAGREIGPGRPPLIVAEMSANHNGSLERARQILRAAREAGAGAVKLQTYKPETMTLDLDRAGYIAPAGTKWAGQKLFDLYARAMTPWEWHPELFELGRELGLIVFSTPFDETAVDFLEELGAPAHKVASFELVDLPLLKKLAATGKPIIASTGLASLAEIEAAVRTVRRSGGGPLILLKCASAYPAPPEAINLAAIPHLAQTFDLPAGLSDHTLGCGVAAAAAALGACLIEKHFKLSPEDEGPDAAFSLDPAEMKRLCQEVERAWQALGRVSYGGGLAESPNLAFRRSIIVSQDIPAGAELSPANLKRLRPNLGLAPAHYEALLGRRAARDLKRGQGLTWSDVA